MVSNLLLPPKASKACRSLTPFSTKKNTLLVRDPKNLLKRVFATRMCDNSIARISGCTPAIYTYIIQAIYIYMDTQPVIHAIGVSHTA